MSLLAPVYCKYNFAVRTLAIAFALSLSLPACGKDKQKSSEPPVETEPAAEPQAPAPAKAHKLPGDVHMMTTDEVKKKVEQAGKEHADQIDEALDVE